MGFFSTSCGVCGGKVVGVVRAKTKDNKDICGACLDKAGLYLGFRDVDSRVSVMSVEDVKNTIEKRNTKIQELSRSFTITKEVNNCLRIDENQRKWYILKDSVGVTEHTVVHSFDDVIDFELLEDGNSIIKGGIGSAVVGSVLFGEVGAIVGAVTGKKKVQETCSSLVLKLTLNNMNQPTEYINFISKEIPKDCQLYINSKENAQECISLFQLMCDSNKKSKIVQQPKHSTVSVADEIKKFKELLDIGAITQEEFDAKKKQLLGI